MATRLGASPNFPSSWHELYAHYAGRLKRVLEHALLSDVEPALCRDEWLEVEQEFADMQLRLAQDAAAGMYAAKRRT